MTSDGLYYCTSDDRCVPLSANYCHRCPPFPPLIRLRAAAWLLERTVIGRARVGCGCSRRSVRSYSGRCSTTRASWARAASWCAGGSLSRTS